MTVFRIPSTSLRLNQPIGKADIGIVVYQSSIWFVGLLSTFFNFSTLTTYLMFSVQPVATNHSQSQVFSISKRHDFFKQQSNGAS